MMKKLIFAVLLLVPALALADQWNGKCHFNGPDAFQCDSGGTFEMKSGSTFTVPAGTITSADIGTGVVGISDLASLTRYVPAMIGKAGTTAGWVVGTANLGEVTLPASQTGSTLVIPITDLLVGETVSAFKVVGQIESAGGAVTLDADLRKLTNAAADPADASIGAITQVAVTADTAVASSKTLAAAEVIASGESLYLLVTGTTAATTDVRLLGVELVVD